MRNDSGVYEGAEVSANYDPLLAKLVVWAEDRPRALARLGRALVDYTVGGIRTNLAFLSRVITHPEFARGQYDIGFIDTHLEALLADPESDSQTRLLVSAAAAVSTHERSAAEIQNRESRGNSLSPWVLAQRSALK